MAFRPHRGHFKMRGGKYKISINMCSNSKKWFQMSRTIECNKICRTNDKNIYEVEKGT